MTDAPETENPAQQMPGPAPRPRVPRWVIWGGSALVLVGVGAALWWSQRPSSTPATLTLKPESLVETVDVSGVVLSERDVTLKASLGGSVLARLVAENQRVKPQTPLLQLDGRNYQLQLEQTQISARNNLRQAQSELEAAQRSLQQTETQLQRSLLNLRNQVQKAEEHVFFLSQELLRQQRLHAEGVVSDQSISQQQAQLEQARRDLRNAELQLQTALQTSPERTTAQNRLKQAQTVLETAQRLGPANERLSRDNLRQMRILAPFAGSVTQWQLDKGDFAAPGTPVARFQDLEDLRLRLTVNELDFPRIKLGAEVDIVFDAYPEQHFKGSVVWMSASTVAGNENIQVFPIKVWFANPRQQIKPGMSGDAEIIAQRKPNVLAVPIGAVQREGDKYFVSVLRGDTVEKVEVTIGMSSLEKVEITSGLKAGDQLVFEQALPSASPGQ